MRERTFTLLFVLLCAVVGGAQGQGFLEPTGGGVYVGVNGPQDVPLANFASLLGYNPASYVFFVNFPLGPADVTVLEGYFAQVSSLGAIAVLTVEPKGGLSSVTLAACEQLAGIIAKYEAQGLVCYLRFGHEMNGVWHPWGQQPLAYVGAFRLLAAAIRKSTCRTAMVWAPNDGTGYPYSGAGNYTAKAGSQDFALMDTNRDGALSTADDMYSPFYPGDDVVDWVGMTHFYYGNEYPYGENEVPSARRWTNLITGSANGLPNFYSLFCNATTRQKPMVITETAALYNTNRTAGASALDIKSAWLKQVFALGGDTATELDMSIHFPRVKMINWFEVIKPEAEANNDIIDWRIGANPAVRSQLLSLLNRTLPSGAKYWKFLPDVRADLPAIDRCPARAPGPAPALIPGGAALSPSSSAAPRSLALLEPPRGTYFGINPDINAPLSGYTQSLGVKPTAYVVFVTLPMPQSDKDLLEGILKQVATLGGMVIVTPEPLEGLKTVTEAACEELATLLAKYEAQGVSCLIRFAHEMNGSWYPWGQQPTAYKAAFRLMAGVIKRLTCRTGMLWAPNDGSGYPFPAGANKAVPGTPDFALLDTNKDGALTMADDMYTPYYPGDDVVDWVGMTLYMWGLTYPWGNNTMPWPRQFADQITGNYDGPNGNATAVPNFYAMFCEDGVHNKPMAIPETAAFYNTKRVVPGGPSEYAIKEAWLDQVFHLGPDTSSALNIATNFPRIKLINWFEHLKTEAEAQGDLVDWRIGANPQVKSAFLSKLNATGSDGKPWFLTLEDYKANQAPLAGTCLNKVNVTVVQPVNGIGTGTAAATVGGNTTTGGQLIVTPVSGGCPQGTRPVTLSSSTQNGTNCQPMATVSAAGRAGASDLLALLLVAVSLFLTV